MLASGKIPLLGPDRTRPDPGLRGLCPVGSGRASVVEFSYSPNQIANKIAWNNRQFSSLLCYGQHNNIFITRSFYPFRYQICGETNETK